MGKIRDAVDRLIKDMAMQKNTEQLNSRIIKLDPNEISQIIVSKDCSKSETLRYRKTKWWEELFSGDNGGYVIYDSSIKHPVNKVWSWVVSTFSWQNPRDKIFWITDGQMLQCVNVDLVSGDVYFQPYAKVCFKDPRRDKLTLYVNPDDSTIFNKIEEMKNTSKIIWIDYEL